VTNTVPQIEKVVYTAKAHTTGGRDGEASRTSDGRLDVKFSVSGGPGTDPEHSIQVTPEEEKMGQTWRMTITLEATNQIPVKRKRP
jgi:hypothetical protein